MDAKQPAVTDSIPEEESATNSESKDGTADINDSKEANGKGKQKAKIEEEETEEENVDEWNGDWDGEKDDEKSSTKADKVDQEKSKSEGEEQ